MARNKTTAETGYVGFEITNADAKTKDQYSTLAGFDTLANKFIKQGIKSATEQQSQFKLADKIVDYQEGIAKQIVVVQKQAEQAVQEALTTIETQVNQKFDTSKSSGELPQYINKLQEQFVRITGERVMKSTTSGHQRDVKKAMQEAMSKYSGGNISFDSANVGKFDFLISESEWNKYKAEYENDLQRGIKRPKSIESRIADTAFATSSKLDTSLLRKERKEEKARQIEEAEAEEQKKEEERIKAEQKQREEQQKAEEKYRKQVQTAYDKQQLHFIDLIEGYKQKKNFAGVSFEDLFNEKVLAERKAGTIQGNLSRQDTVAIYQEIEEEDAEQKQQQQLSLQRKHKRNRIIGNVVKAGAKGAQAGVQGVKSAFSSGKAILGNILKIVALQGLLVNITRRILTSVLDNASKAKTNAVEGITLGVTGQQLQYYNVLEKTYGLKPDTFKGAMQGIQKMFGNITNLDEKALGELARVMGGKVTDLVNSGMGGSNPEELMGLILDSYFQQYKQGKNSVGQYIGQQGARRELVSALSLVSPEMSKILERWIEADRVGKWSGKVNTFSEFVNAVPRHYMDVTDIETNQSANRGENWQYIKGRWDTFFDDLKKKMAFVFDPIMRWLATTRFGMSEEQKLIENTKAKESSRAKLAELEPTNLANKKAIKDRLKANAKLSDLADKDFTKLTDEQLALIYAEDQTVLLMLANYQVMQKKIKDLQEGLKKANTYFFDYDYDDATLDELTKLQLATITKNLGSKASVVAGTEMKEQIKISKETPYTREVKNEEILTKDQEDKIKKIQKSEASLLKDKNFYLFPDFTGENLEKFLKENPEVAEQFKTYMSAVNPTGASIQDRIKQSSVTGMHGWDFAKMLAFQFNTELAGEGRGLLANYGVEVSKPEKLQGIVKTYKDREEKLKAMRKRMKTTYGVDTAEQLANLDKLPTVNIDNDDIEWLRKMEEVEKVYNLLSKAAEVVYFSKLFNSDMPKFAPTILDKTTQTYRQGITTLKSVERLGTPENIALTYVDTIQEIQEALRKELGVKLTAEQLKNATVGVSQKAGDIDQTINLFLTVDGEQKNYTWKKPLHAGAEKSFNVSGRYTDGKWEQNVDSSIQKYNTIGD